MITKALMVWVSVSLALSAFAQTTSTNAILRPLVDLGPGQTYHGQEGGLYPGGSNVRPAAHDAAGQKIARGIVPLDAEDNPDPVNGKIVLLPVSVSNGYGAWHRGDETNTSTTFMTRANSNPAKNPRLFIAYGFEYQLPGGNRGTGDPGPNSIFYKTLDHALKEQGVTPRQVQIVWLSMPVSGTSWGTNLPPEARTFPADAQQSKLAWKEIIHAIHTRYPNVKIIYSSTKGAMYMTPQDNAEFDGGPIEPWNHDAAWGVKWVIEDQIKGALDLNYDPARGPVKAPWLSWGPYFWSYPEGTPRRYDGFVWNRTDVAEDGLHPSLSGLTKYANMLLHQMTTDPTATPWFLRSGARSAFEILEVGRWSNPPTTINPLATHCTYHSAAMKVDVGYTIYLPPGYATDSARHPVIYWLPGGGCNEDPDSPSLAPGLLSGIDAAIRSGKLPPLIFVIVNGGRYTRYYDSLDGTIMMETTVIRELMPHIDATYRTVASREGRALQGESMGGMGSLKFAFKYPELFSSAVAFCPALLDADTNMKRNPTLIPALFNGDKSLFAKDSPAAMLVTNADSIRGRLAIKIVIGSEDGLLEWSEKLHASMVKLKISHEFEIVGGVGHDFGPKGKYELQLRALRYAADHFALP